MFPARAGMSRSFPQPPNPCTCVPRASGDEPQNAAGEWETIKCSPRERG